MPRPDVSDERRRQIIDAAIQLFSRQGYRKTTMPEVARAAGLSIGGIYWYFKSKEALVAAILEQLFQDDREALAILLNSAAPAGERLRAFAVRYSEGHQHYEWLDAVGVEFYSEAAHDPAARAVIQSYLTHYREALVTLIEQGILRGEFRPVSPSDTANVLLGLEEGLALLSVADPERVRWRESFLIGVELMLAGLTSKD